MTRTEKPPPTKRLTARGAKTRARIVAAATDLIRRRGITATTIDDVAGASEVSKSQLYSHFAGKDALVRAVIDDVGKFVLERERKTLSSVSTIAGLRQWRDSLVDANALRHGAYGCALGSLASEVADQDDVARRALADLFEQWHKTLADALRRIQTAGEIATDARVDDLAIGLIAALQGGYLLAQTARDVMPMAISLDMALTHLESLTND